MFFDRILNRSNLTDFSTQLKKFDINILLSLGVYKGLNFIYTYHKKFEYELLKKKINDDFLEVNIFHDDSLLHVRIFPFVSAAGVIVVWLV